MRAGSCSVCESLVPAACIHIYSVWTSEEPAFEKKPVSTACANNYKAPCFRANCISPLDERPSSRRCGFHIRLVQIRVITILRSTDTVSENLDRNDRYLVSKTNPYPKDVSGNYCLPCQTS